MSSFVNIIQDRDGTDYYLKATIPSVESTAESVTATDPVSVDVDVDSDGVVSFDFHIPAASTANADAAAQEARDAADACEAATSAANTAATGATTAAQNAVNATVDTVHATQDARTAITDTQAATASANAAASAASSAKDATIAATTAANEATTAATTATSNANTATANANAATTAANAAATRADASADAADTATDDANAAAARAEEAAKPTEEMFASYHALLRAGASEGIASDANPVQSSFLNRASGSAEGVRDGIATIECIKGNTVGWNQRVSTWGPNEINTSGLTRSRGATGGVDISGTVTAKARVPLCGSLTFKRDGRKYLIKTSKDVGHPINVGGYTLNTSTRAFIFSNNSGTDWWNNVVMDVNVDDEVNLTDVHVSVIDLTKIFGTGKEPSTVEEFEALYPEPYYPYDSGTLKPVMFEGMETIGFNAYDPDSGTADVITGNVYQIIGTYTAVAYSDGTAITPDSSGYFTPDRNDSIVVTGGNSTDTCIHLKWSGYRDGEYEEYWKAQREIAIAEHFPTGMKAVGTKFDALYKDHADHVVGAVDLGTLNWSRLSNGVFHGQTITDCVDGVHNTIKCRCARYTSVPTQSGSEYFAQMGDKVITLQLAHPYVFVNDSSYTDAADLKASLSGVMLYYELANSAKTTEVIDPPLNLGYKVSDFGTERVMLADGVISAPPVFDIAYGYTAESLRDAAASIVAPVENHLAQDNYAIGSYLVRDGVLYKVTAAIARNESIVPGTNVTATTVMAEIAAISV